MGDRRLFIALDISDAARTACASHVRFLRQTCPDARVGWERAEKLHITLRFLGDTSPNILERFHEGISEIASQHAGFQLRLSQSGVFPSRSRPRILWIGVEDVAGRIMLLHRQIEGLSRTCGFEADEKAFRPHVTIGRVRQRERATELAGVHLKTPIEPIAFDVSEIVIYESQLRPNGSEYSAVSRAKLRLS